MNGYRILFFCIALTYTPTHAASHINYQKIAGSNIEIPTEQDKHSNNFYAEIAFATNYIFRGISESNNQPVVQGLLSYVFPIGGFYALLFASNDDLKGKRNKTLTYEMDPSIGISNNIGKHFVYDLSYSYYNYPQSRTDSYGEFGLDLAYYFLTSQFSYSNNDQASGKSGRYYNLGFTYELPKSIFYIEGLTVSGGMGYSSFPRKNGLRRYKDYRLNIKKSIDKFTFLLQWSDTDRNAEEPTKLKNSKIIGLVTIDL